MLRFVAFDLECIGSLGLCLPHLLQICDSRFECGCLGPGFVECKDGLVPFMGDRGQVRSELDDDGRQDVWVVRVILPL